MNHEHGRRIAVDAMHRGCAQERFSVGLEALFDYRLLNYIAQSGVNLKAVGVCEIVDSVERDTSLERGVDVLEPGLVRGIVGCEGDEFKVVVPPC